MVLGFIAGTFLYIALVNMLPAVIHTKGLKNTFF